MKIPEFKKIIYNEILFKDYLIEQDILRIPMCSICREPMSETNDPYKYRCYLRRNKKKCSNDGSLLKGSYFHHAKLSAKELMILLCEWCKGSSNISASIELDVAPSTITRWYSRFNKSVSDFIFSYIHSQQIGGDDCIVEIDETVLVKNKYHQGRLLEYQVWAIGGVVRGHAHTFFIEIVEDRSRNTIIEILRRKIAPGSTILTDMWRGYLNLETICVDLGFRHITVNHSENFVDPETGAHTQTIEGMWSVIKRKIRKDGTNHGTLLNLVEKIYVDRFKLLYKDDLLEEMIDFMRFENN